MPSHAEPPFTRAIVIVLDGLGVGELPDAAEYGDAGSDTLGHIARRIPLRVPTLRALGLGSVAPLGGDPHSEHEHGAVGRMAEASAGKDSVTGHWEMMGVVLERAFPVFPNGFSAGTITEFSRLTGRGVLGNTAASGTEIINELGTEHLRTGAFIVYTSADSVFQIAAHEAVVPLESLYHACEIAFELVGKGLGVGRVIARPFVGDPGGFTRTGHRRDYALPPPHDTLLDRLVAASLPVIAIGKIEDLFARRGISAAYHTASDEEGMDVLARQMESVERGLIFVNLVDFDTLYGHRNDVAGYARNLEWFDGRLSTVQRQLREDDLCMITGDHGNDPTTPGTDHSREYVPLLVTGRHVRARATLGTRGTFADVGQTLADLFGIQALRHGTSFLSEIAR